MQWELYDSDCRLGLRVAEAVRIRWDYSGLLGALIASDS
jgi:hypothetical protein